MDPLTEDKVAAMKAKIVGSIVKIQIKDGRQFIGRFACIDKTKAIFI